MKFFKNIARLIWRIWYYAWAAGTVIAIFPVLLILTSKEKWYPIYYKIARAWGKTILFVMGFKAKITPNEKIDINKSHMFIANHTSMIDIMLMLVTVKNPIVFVAKKEVRNIPILGLIFKRSSILVDRSDSESRNAVFAEAQRRLDNGMSICIFPEGLVPEEKVVLSEFKNGAFRLAIEHQIPIVPQTFYDCKKRFSYTFFSGGPGDLRVKVHDVIETKGLTLDDRDQVKKQTYDLIYNDLINDSKNT